MRVRVRVSMMRVHGVACRDACACARVRERVRVGCH
jgi:hypothetical protein